MSHTVISTVGKGEFAATSTTTPYPRANEVLIKVHYALISALDSHQIEDGYRAQYPMAVGVALSGEVVKIGEDVENILLPGDMVCALTFPPAERASQEYVVAEKHFVAKIPDNIKPEAAAALPDNFVSAWWTVSHSLGLPLPEPGSELILDPAVTSEPILIWAAGTSASQYILQVLKYAGYKNIIATASKRSFAAALRFGATQVFDYNDPDVANRIRDATGGKAIRYAVDTVALSTSLQGIAHVLEGGSKVAVFLPLKVGDVKDVNSSGHTFTSELSSNQNPFKEGVEVVYALAPEYTTHPHLKDDLLPRILPDLLASGRIIPPSVRVLDSGSVVERFRDAARLVKTGLGGERSVVKIT